MILRADTVAHLLGVSRATVYNMFRDGRLQSLALEDVVALIRQEAYQAGYGDAVEELRRAGRLRRRDHRACRTSFATRPR